MNPRASVVALAFALAAAPAQADPSSTILRELAWAGADTPGCAVAVERDEVRLATVATGLAELEHGAPITAETVFEAGSVAKQFTAAAIVLLAQDGKLRLDDSVRKWFPELPAYADGITIERLLNHTNGLRDWGSLYAMAGWPRTTRAYTQADALDMIVRQTAANFPAGAEWSYGNSGYTLAALLVERASGKTLAAFTAERLFAPLGMSSTRWRDDFRAVIKGRAVAYQPAAGGWAQLAPFEDTHGHGGLLTTVGDLLVWNRALEADRFGLGSGLAKRGVLNDGAPTGYGLGLFLDDRPGRREVAHGWATAALSDQPGRREVSHGGATAGYRAFVGRHWAAGSNGPPVSTAVLCNSTSADAAKIARAAVDGVLGHAPAQAPPAPSAASAGPPPARAFDPTLAGRWRSDELGATLILGSAADGALSVGIDRRPGRETTMRPIGPDAWTGAGVTLRAVRWGRGAVVAVTLTDARVRELRLTRETD